MYTFSWPEPDRDGQPAGTAPHGPLGWRPDAQAVAIRGDRIVFVGERVNAEAYRGSSTHVIDLNGATVLPGLIDSHVHLPELGAALERVNLVGVQTEADAVVRVPIHGRAESLNLATAAAVCLYASARAQRAADGCRSVTGD